jgi:hypothetical protein
LHALADAYIHFRKRSGAASDIRLEAAGYLSRADMPYFENVKRRLDAAGLLSEFTYRGAVDRDGKLAFLQTLDVLSVPAPVRRAERRVPAGGDGERRAGGATAAVAPSPRSSRRPAAACWSLRTIRWRSAKHCSSSGRTVGRRRRSASADSRASARTTASRIPPIDFSRCVPR